MDCSFIPALGISLTDLRTHERSQTQKEHTEGYHSNGITEQSRLTDRASSQETSYLEFFVGHNWDKAFWGC